jgi:hypothetical protein
LNLSNLSKESVAYVYLSVTNKKIENSYPLFDLLKINSNNLFIQNDRFLSENDQFFPHWV